MNTTRLTLARKLFFHDLVPTRMARHNARAWARSLRMLGPRWVGLSKNRPTVGGNHHA